MDENESDSEVTTVKDRSFFNRFDIIFIKGAGGAIELAKYGATISGDLPQPKGWF